MYRLSVLAWLALIPVAAQVQPNPNWVLSPLVGAGARGDGGPALGALLDGPFGVAEDASGNLYISELNSGSIRRVRPDGTIERFAGTGNLLDGPAGSPALATDLMAPSHLLSGADGLYFFDSKSCRIRRIGNDGIVSDIAGTGSCNATGGFGGGTTRDRLARETVITGIGGMAFDANGRLVYSETSRHIVRRLDNDGYIRTIAGTGLPGYGGDGFDATSGTLDGPAGLAADASGNLYIADGFNCRIRVIDPNGQIATLLGTSSCARNGSNFTGSSTTAMDRVDAIAWDAGTNALFITLPRVYRIVRFDIANARVAPVAGTGATGTQNSTVPLRMPLNNPTSMTVSAARGLVIADFGAYQVYGMQGGAIGAVAGQWPQSDSYASASGSVLLSATSVAAARDGSVLVSDTDGRRLLQWQSPDQLSALAGLRYPAGQTKSDSTVALQSTLDSPRRIAIRQNGEIFIAEASRIRAIDSSGSIRSVRSNLSDPAGIVFDAQDRLLISEAGQHRVLRLDLAANTITVLAGTAGKPGFSGDGAAATSALLDTPGDLAFDANGNLLIADRGNRRIRAISADGNINTVIGSGFPFSYGDITGQSALATGFDPITGITTDGNGNTYVAEPQRVSRVAPDGTISIVTGFLRQDDSGTIQWIDGPLAGVSGISVDSKGQVYIAIGADGRVLAAIPR